MLRKRKKNPQLQGVAKEILSEVDNWEYLSEGGYGEVYYFVIYEPIEINRTKLQPGEYVLKIEKLKLNDEQIQYLKELSKLELIPKIYFIDENIQIMKYIEGKTLDDLMHTHYGYRTFSRYISDENKIAIYINFKNLIQKWHRKGYAHGDLNITNILIDKKYNVYFIDPKIWNGKISSINDKESFRWDKIKFADIIKDLDPNIHNDLGL